MDVLEQGEKICILIAENGLVPALKQVSDRAVSSIEVKGVALVNALKNLRKGDALCFDQKMDVIAHQYIGVEAAVITVFIDREYLEVFLAVRNVLKYFLLLVSSGDYVIERAIEFDSGLSCHNERIAKESSPVNMSISKSDPIYCSFLLFLLLYPFFFQLIQYFLGFFTDYIFHLRPFIIFFLAHIYIIRIFFRC